MKKNSLCLLILLWYCTGAAAAQPRNVLVHSSGAQIWYARVSSAAAPGALVPAEKTEAFARQIGPGQPWVAMPLVSGRAVAMASHSSQLVLLMADGQWLKLWGERSVSGEPLPADGKILTLGDDGENLWAIGSVPGGLPAADEAIALEAASTQPTSSPASFARPATPATSPSTKPAALESKQVLFHQVSGRWATFAELPREATLYSGGAVSLVVIEGAPVVSYRISRDAIQTVYWQRDHHWVTVAPMEPSANPIDEFKLLNDGNKPLLWCTRAGSAGELFFESTSPLRSVSLSWKSDQPLQGIPAATFSGGFVRVLGARDSKIYEQRYEPSGNAVAEAAALAGPPGSGDATFSEAVEAFFLTAVAFAIGASIFRQAGGTDSAGPESAVAAPLSRRLGAGLVDLLPVIAAAVFALTHDGEGPAANAPSVLTLEVVAAAIVVYLLHTTLSELLTRRTIGKRIFGLTVVAIGGDAPSAGQILIRNLLRVIDPLVMIIVSPLRQRSADVVAGTIVVRVGPAAVGSEAGQTSFPEKTEPRSSKDEAEKDP